MEHVCVTNQFPKYNVWEPNRGIEVFKCIYVYGTLCILIQTPRNVAFGGTSDIKLALVLVMCALVLTGNKFYRNQCWLR